MDGNSEILIAVIGISIIVVIGEIFGWLSLKAEKRKEKQKAIEKQKYMR